MRSEVTTAFFILGTVGLVLLALTDDCTGRPQRHRFVLPQGEVVACHNFKPTDCGLHLIDCGEGHADFDCMVDITYQGREEENARAR